MTKEIPIMTGGTADNIKVDALTALKWASRELQKQNQDLMQDALKLVDALSLLKKAIHLDYCGGKVEKADFEEVTPIINEALKEWGTKHELGKIL